MALNIDLLNSRLRQYEDGDKASNFAKLLWKPKEGTQYVRIVPYKFNPGNPLVELLFYYNISPTPNVYYLAPCTFKKPDPVLEAIEQLKQSGSEAERKVAAKMAPTPRIYAPIIVRGEEDKGVRFWGFGVQVHKQLLQLMTKQKMWGDITSLTDGNDLEIVFKKESKKKIIATGKALPETIITPCPQKTPAVDPNRKDLIEKLNDQVNILDIFPLKSYDEMKTIVETYLNPNADVDTDPQPDAVVQSATPAPVSAPVQTQTGPTESNNFENFFKQNT